MERRARQERLSTRCHSTLPPLPRPSFKSGPRQVKVYAYGAPRAGNHAFAQVSAGNAMQGRAPPGAAWAQAQAEKGRANAPDGCRAAWQKPSTQT